MIKRAITLLLALVLLGCSSDEAGSFGNAPDFSLKDLTGRNITLGEYRGKIVLIDFWATWCPPCRMSIPELVDLQNKYRDQGVVILGLSMDDPQQISDGDLKRFADQFKINYKILHVDYQVVRDYFGMTQPAIPTLFIVNREGIIVDKQVGYNPGAAEKSIKRLL